MNISNFIQELKRRNVIKVAVAYAIAGWLIIQIAATVFPTFNFPEWTTQFVIILTLIGLPISVIIAWAFELTPEGIQKSEDVEITESVTASTGKKLNGVIITVLSVAIIFLVIERIFFAPTVKEVDQIKVSTVSNQSVAVLPFADLSEKNDQEWFSDGLTEEILNSLAQLPELKVTSRTSAFQFKGKDIDISIIADTLGVANVVEGSVRRIGDKLRVTAQLIRANDGFHLWSETYDSNTDDLFEVQTDIAEEIATTLDIFLDDEKRESMFAAGTRNVEAFQAYLKGVEVYMKAHEGDLMEGVFKANEYFNRALELDPNFGEAALLKMDAYAHILIDGGKTDSNISLNEAKSELIKTLEYGAEHVDSPALKIATKMNTVFFSDSWHQLPSLKEDFKKALGEKERFPAGSIWVSEILMLYEEDEILEKDTRADIELDPFNLTSWSYRAIYKNKKEGLQAFRKVIADSRVVNGGNLFIDKYEHLYIALSGETELLKSIYPDGITNTDIQEPILIQIDAFLAASIGDVKVADELINLYTSKVDFIDDIMILTYYKLNRIEEANALIRKLDSQPSGPANLALAIATFGNKLFFNLEDAPNTVARFKEAGIDINKFKKLPWIN